MEEGFAQREWEKIEHEFDGATLIRYRQCVRCYQKCPSATSYDEHLVDHPECMVSWIHQQ